MSSRLKHLREARGIQQLDLAEQLNISAGNLSLIESGRRRPSPAVAQKMAEILSTESCQLEVGDIFPDLQ